MAGYDGYGMPSVDFGILGNLPDTYRKAQAGDLKLQQERSLADLGKQLASGDIDYRQAAGIAAQAGRTDLSLALLTKANERQAYQDFTKSLGQGGDQPTPSAPQPTLATLGKPPARPPMGGMAPEEGAPAGIPDQPWTPRTSYNQTDKIVSAVPQGPGPNEGVNVAAPSAGGQPPPAQPPPVAPPANPQAAPGIPPQAVRLLATLANPDLPASARQSANILLQRMMPEDKIITDADGTTIAVNPNGGAPRVLYKGTSKPTVVPYGASLADAQGHTIRPADESALLDPQTITQMAQQLKAGDTSVLTNLGRGAQGAQNIMAVRKKMAELNAAEGKGGADQAVTNAEFFGAKSGQRTLGTKQANIEMAATEFKQVLPVIQEASAKVSRTNYPDLNRIIQAYETKTGDPNIVAFGGGVNTLVNLYSRAISPNGTPTVSDKDHAREILSKAWSQGQFDAAVGMMKQEIDAALNSPEKVRDDMRKRFLGGQGKASPETTTAPADKPAVVDWHTYFSGGR